MPTYHYECTKCGNTFDLFQSMSASSIQECTACKGEAHRHMGMGSGVHYKGAGFYLTDYKGNKGGKTDPTPAPASTPSATPAATPAAPAPSTTTTASSTPTAASKPATAAS